jgi:hypothetical protein
MCRWEEMTRSLGLLEALVDVNIIAKTADQVCTAHQAFCKGPYQQYISKAACLMFMTMLPPPPVHRMAGNNIECR